MNDYLEDLYLDLEQVNMELQLCRTRDELKDKLNIKKWILQDIKELQAKQDD